MRHAVYLSFCRYANHVTPRYGTLKGWQISSKNRSPTRNNALLYCRQLTIHEGHRDQMDEDPSKHCWDAYRKMMGWQAQSIFAWSFLASAPVTLAFAPSGIFNSLAAIRESAALFAEHNCRYNSHSRIDESISGSNSRLLLIDVLLH